MSEGNEGAPLIEPKKYRDELIEKLKKIQVKIDKKERSEDRVKNISANANYSLFLKTIIEAKKIKYKPTRPLFVCVGQANAELMVAYVIAPNPDACTPTLVDKQIPQEAINRFKAAYPDTKICNQTGLIAYFIEALSNDKNKHDGFVMLGADYLLLEQPEFKDLLPEVLAELLEPESLVFISPHMDIRPENWSAFNLVYGSQPNEQMIIATRLPE